MNGMAIGLAGVAAAVLGGGAYQTYTYNAQDTAVVEPASAVVKMLVKDGPTGGDLGYGSGTYLGNGYFVTAGHVVAEPDKQRYYADDGKHTFEVKVITADYKADWAIVRAIDPKATEADLRQADMTPNVPAPGSPAVAMGYPSGYSLLTINGSVMGKVQARGVWKDAIPLHTTGAPGISGGPIFDASGHLFGLFVSGEAPWGGTGIAVPVSLIYATLGTAAVDGIDGTHYADAD